MITEQLSTYRRLSPSKTRSRLRCANCQPGQNCQRKRRLEAELALVEYTADKAIGEGRLTHFGQYWGLGNQLRKELREATYCLNCPHQTEVPQEIDA